MAVQAAVADVDAVPRIIRTRPPDVLNWVAKAKPCIDSKEHGIIPFKPWPVQQAVMRKRVEGGIIMIKKGRQIGLTTCIEIADVYLLLFRKPFNCHYVSSSDELGFKMLKEVRLALETADIPDDMRACIGGMDAARTPKVTFETDKMNNYIHAHAPVPRLTGFHGNAVLLDECAVMPGFERIHAGFGGMLSDGWISEAMVSHPDCDGVSQQAFNNLFDIGSQNPDVWDLQADWRAKPGRDEAWFRKQLLVFGGREDLRDQAHCCLDIMPQDMAFDPDRMTQEAKQTPFLSQWPQPGHNYAIGVDQSGSGACDTVAVVIDVSVRPAQVAKIEIFVMDKTSNEFRTQQRARWMDQVGSQYPGQLLVDCTNEMGTIQTVRLPNKIAVSITGQVNVTERVDDGIRKLTWPRAKLMENAVKLTDTGAVIVHPERFPELYEAFSTAKKHRRGESNKRTGKNVDHLDAFLLACIPLTGRSMGVQNDAGGRVVGTSRQKHRKPKRFAERRPSQWERGRR